MEENCCRLGVKRCRRVPGWGQAGTFRWGNVPVEENCCRLGTERCRSVPGWDRRAHFGGETFPGREIAAACAQKGARACPSGDRRAHFGGEMFLWRKIAAAWARKRVPERTRVGNREEPGEGERARAGAKGKKKGSIRGGVLPYVGEGRRLLPLDCCRWLW